jgi:mono/diheme cytochrome c family protein
MSRFITSFTAAVVAASFFGFAASAWAQAPGPWEAPAAEKTKKSPGGNIANGKKLAETNCFSCHGASGKGDGPAAAALNPKPADWTSPKVQAESEGTLFWKISNGRGPMPPWKHLPDKDRWDLVSYVKSLGKK